MSDSDDTDFLLLIPPNFFLVNTDSEDSYYENHKEKSCDYFGVVNSLIKQVHSLENRLDKIELTSNNSTLSYNSNMTDMSDNLDNYLPNSTKSTPQKPKNKFKMRSLPSTPSSEKSILQNKFQTQPRKTFQRNFASARRAAPPLQRNSADESLSENDNKETLSEIDRFLNSVKSIKNLSTQNSSKSRFQLDQPIITLQDLKNENINKLESLYENKNFSSKSESNSELTFQTVLEKNSTISNFIKNKSSKNSDQFSSAECFELPQKKFSSMSEQVPNLNLFSLTDIWNVNKMKSLNISEEEMKNLLPKLEEEKCRRKHCEKLIQDLQVKILEMQQRLAVAIKVDSAKDEAILKFHDAWEKVANRWKNLECERNFLSQKLLSVEEKSSMDLAEATKKVSQYETEMSKALDLAHNSQEKCNLLEIEKSDFLDKFDKLKLELKHSQDHLVDISKNRDDLIQKILLLEKDSSNDKKILLETRTELEKNQIALSNCQKDLSVLKDDNIKLLQKIDEKQSIISDLETQKNNLETSIDSLQKNELSLQQKLTKIQSDSELSKTELRNFYQNQVENLVKDKLKEFQEQLETAEKSLQDELQNREQIIAKNAAKQLQKLSEKHRLEIQLIEEKHYEETQLFKLQFSQMKQQINLLQNKLQSYQQKSKKIAQELHNVMQNQWIEALKIINEDEKRPILENPNLKTHQNKNTADEETEKIKLRSKNTVTDQMQILETPRGRGNENLTGNQENELQKYVKLLLDKMPKNLSEKSSKEDNNALISSQENSTSEFHDVLSFTQIPAQKEIDRSGILFREQKSGKPPWK